MGGCTIIPFLLPWHEAHWEIPPSSSLKSKSWSYKISVSTLFELINWRCHSSIQPLSSLHSQLQPNQIMSHSFTALTSALPMSVPVYAAFSLVTIEEWALLPSRVSPRSHPFSSSQRLYFFNSSLFLGTSVSLDYLFFSISNEIFCDIACLNIFSGQTFSSTYYFISLLFVAKILTKLSIYTVSTFFSLIFPMYSSLCPTPHLTTIAKITKDLHVANPVVDSQSHFRDLWRNW